MERPCSVTVPWRVASRGPLMTNDGSTHVPVTTLVAVTSTHELAPLALGGDGTRQEPVGGVPVGWVTPEPLSTKVYVVEALSPPIRQRPVKMSVVTGLLKPLATEAGAGRPAPVGKLPT